MKYKPDSISEEEQEFYHAAKLMKDKIGNIIPYHIIFLHGQNIKIITILSHIRCYSKFN